jgi:hypothetical protein
MKSPRHMRHALITNIVNENYVYGPQSRIEREKKVQNWLSSTSATLDKRAHSL